MQSFCLGNITQARVYINDEKDTPTLQFVETQYTVEERDTVVSIPVKRTGNFSNFVSPSNILDKHLKKAQAVFFNDDFFQIVC